MDRDKDRDMDTDKNRDRDRDPQEYMQMGLIPCGNLFRWE